MSWAFVPTLGIDLLSLRLPAFNVRYFLIALPAWIGIIVIGLSGRSQRPKMALLGRSVSSLSAAVFLIGTTLALHNNYGSDSRYHRDDYRRAFALIRSEALPD